MVTIHAVSVVKDLRIVALTALGAIRSASLAYGGVTVWNALVKAVKLVASETFSTSVGA